MATKYKNINRQSHRKHAYVHMQSSDKKLCSSVIKILHGIKDMYVWHDYSALMAQLRDNVIVMTLTESFLIAGKERNK